MATDGKTRAEEAEERRRGRDERGDRGAKKDNMRKKRAERPGGATKEKR